MGDLCHHSSLESCSIATGDIYQAPGGGHISPNNAVSLTHARPLLAVQTHGLHLVHECERPMRVRLVTELL